MFSRIMQNLQPEHPQGTPAFSMLRRYGVDVKA